MDKLILPSKITERLFQLEAEVAGRLLKALIQYWDNNDRHPKGLEKVELALFESFVDILKPLRKRAVKADERKRERAKQPRKTRVASSAIKRVKPAVPKEDVEAMQPIVQQALTDIKDRKKRNIVIYEKLIEKFQDKYIDLAYDDKGGVTLFATPRIIEFCSSSIHSTPSHS